jgi:hypothetical protein
MNRGRWRRSFCSCRRDARPHKMTFDRDPLLSSGGVQELTFLPLCAASRFVFGDRTQWLSAAAARQERICRACFIERIATRVPPAPSSRDAKSAYARSPRRSSSIPTGSARERRRTCGNVPPRVAFPFLPTLPALPQQVDPDWWLTALDRAPHSCVASARMAVPMWICRPILSIRTGLGVRFFYRWKPPHGSLWSGTPKRLVKTVPIKGLMGREMSIDDYLTHMNQEALAHARRASPHMPWNLRQLPHRSGERRALQARG